MNNFFFTFNLLYIIFDYDQIHLRITLSSTNKSEYRISWKILDLSRKKLIQEVYAFNFGFWISGKMRDLITAIIRF